MAAKISLRVVFLLVFALYSLKIQAINRGVTIRVYCVDSNKKTHKLLESEKKSLKIDAVFSEQIKGYLLSPNLYAYLNLSCRFLLREKNLENTKLLGSNASSFESITTRFPVTAYEREVKLPWHILTEDELDEEQDPFPFLREDPEEKDDQTMGHRSFMMTNKLLQYREDGRSIVYNQKIYSVITSETTEFFDEYIASIGAGLNSREIITVDDSDQETLDRLYGNFQIELTKIIKHEDFYCLYDRRILSLIKNFLYVKIFTDRSQSEITQLSSRYLAEGKYLSLAGLNVAVVPIREYINRHLGLCRHFALVYAYLVSRLQSDGFLRTGDIHIQRDTIKYFNPNEPFARSREEGHAWNVFAYRGGESIFHIDATWNLLFDLKQHHVLPEVVSHYGAAVIRRELKRYRVPEPKTNLGALPIETKG